MEEGFLLETREVRMSPGVIRAREYFLGRFEGNELQLIYLGQEAAASGAEQVHIFTRE